MQNTKWLRIGFFAMLAMAGSATAIACGGDDDDDGSSSGNTADGGSSSGSSGTSGGSSGTSSSSGDAGPTAQKASLFVVHGYNEIGPVRICFASSPDAAPAKNATPNPTPPLPAAGPDGSGPPLLPGTGGILPDLNTDLSSIFIQPYLVKEASRLAQPADKRDCHQLIGADKPLVEGTDYFALDTVPKGALANEKTYVLIALNGGTIGLPPDADAGAGAIKVELKELDTATAVDPAKAGLQFLHASQYIGAAVPTGVTPFLYRPATADAGADGGSEEDKELFAGETPVAALALAPTTAASVDALNAATNGFGIRTPTGDSLHAAPIVGTTLPIQGWANLSDPGQKQKDEDGASLYFQPGRAFTFILVGDPSKGAINPETGDFRGAHFLVIPNDPAVVLP